MSILAAAVAAPARISLRCGIGKQRSTGRIVPPSARGRLVVEYRTPSAATTTRAVAIRPGGRFALPAPPAGPTRTQVWWRGDARHAPAESEPCTTGRR